MTPHVTQNERRPGGSAIDSRTTRHAGYKISQQKRKCIEEVFGWLKTVGALRKTRHRGVFKVGWVFTFAAAAEQPGADAEPAVPGSSAGISLGRSVPKDLKKSFWAHIEGYTRLITSKKHLKNMERFWLICFFSILLVSTVQYSSVLRLFWCGRLIKECSRLARTEQQDEFESGHNPAGRVDPKLSSKSSGRFCVARKIDLSLAGMTYREIEQKLGANACTVSKSTTRFEQDGVQDLQCRQRGSRPNSSAADGHSDFNRCRRVGSANRAARQTTLEFDVTWDCQREV